MLELAVGNHVFLYVFTLKRIKRFGLKGKLALEFFEPFHILDWISAIEYRLALSPASVVHNVFYISIMQKYILDRTHILEDFTVLL